MKCSKLICTNINYEYKQLLLSYKILINKSEYKNKGGCLFNYMGCPTYNVMPIEGRGSL